jgi:tetratricopeptide (TPR) repeat protein
MSGTVDRGIGEVATTPGNPLVLLAPAASTSRAGSRVPIGRLGDEFSVFEVRRGGMGEVYLCGSGADVDPTLALKTFQKRLFFDPASRDAFLREAAIWSRLSGIPHIMVTLGVRMIDARPFVLMPAILGDIVNLWDLLAQRRLAPEEVYRFVWQICFALAQAQDKMPNLVHGDLKPGNLLLLNGDVFVSDFGLARVATAGEAPVTLASTWAYRAPECWDTPGNLSAASDVYAFGVTLYELLLGSAPLHDATAEQWRRWHESHVPSFPDSMRSDLERGLRDLAKVCMTKDPDSRPGNFQDLFQRVNRLGEAADIVQHFVAMVGAARWKQIFTEMQAQLRPKMIRSLLELGAHDAALEELDNLPATMVVGDVSTLRGTALSLNGHDEEALRCFDNALAGDLTAEARRRCLSEKALSLKRLNRFNEAIAIYDELLNSATDRFDPQIVVNLATVYLSASQFARARDLLRNFVRAHPDVPEAWGNLGIAYERLNDLDAAVRAYQRALSLNAMMAHVQVMLAGVLLRLGRVLEADSLLYAAYAQGYQSRDWLVNALAAAALSANKRDLESLQSAAKQGLGPDEMEEVERRVMDLVRLSVGKSTSPSEKEELISGFAIDDTVPETAASAASSDSSASGISLPFFNTRFYVEEGMYSIDFYDDVEKAGYVESFRNAWQVTQRDPRYQIEEMTLRAQTLYFTRCPGCGIYILTNRDIGKRTTCRLCEHAHETSPATDPHLDRLLEESEQAIGRKRLAASPLVHVLLCQHENEEALRAAERICEQAGLKRLPENAPIAFLLLEQGSDSGLVRFSQPYSAWRMDTEGRSSTYQDETPPEIDRLLRSLRHEQPGVRTVSSSLDPSNAHHRALLGSMAELADAVAERAGQTDLEVQAERKIMKGDYEGARADAERMLEDDKHSARALGILGRLAARAGKWTEGIEYLERAAAIDPLDSHVLEILVACYRRTNQEEKAAEAWARLARIGGSRFSR